MIVVGKGHILRALGFQRKTLGANVAMESVCKQRGEIRDGEMRFYYPQLLPVDKAELQIVVTCDACRELLEKR